MGDCLFCKIIKSEVESNIVFEDETFLVFMDKFPETTGHLLIVPKKHIKDVLEMDDETFKKLNSLIKMLITLLEKSLKAEGFTICQNYGICQSIPHYHIHIIPKYLKDIKLSLEEVYKKIMENI